MNLREYATHIFAQAEKLQCYLDCRGETLGFSAYDNPSKHFPQELQESRVALMSACQTMFDLVQGAEDRMVMAPLAAVHDVGIYKLLYHYRIWELVPHHGTISYNDMARSVNLEVKRLTAIVRQLITRRIFLEPKLNQVAHSSASLLIARTEGLQCWLGACTDDIAEAVQAMPETYDNHGLVLDPRYSAFNIARKDYSMGGMALVLSDKQRGPRYSKGLGWTANTQVGSNDSLLNCYPWEQFGVLVDVGGGDGNFSIRLARKYPEMRCIIQDIAAQASYFKPPPDVADRLQYQVHDIFSPQPVQKADAYVFRIVLHVFADDMKAAAILKNVLPVLKENSRILLVDMKLDPQGPVAWSRYQAVCHTQMQSLCGKDRTEEEWAEVVRLASPVLQLGRIVSSPGSLWSVIEIVRKSRKEPPSPLTGPTMPI